MVNEDINSTKKKRNTVPILTDGIGTRISELSKYGKSKKELAEMAGLSESQLHRIISGESQAKVETIAAIVNGTGCSYDWLMVGEQHKYPSDIKQLLKKFVRSVDKIESEVEVVADSDGYKAQVNDSLLGEIRKMAIQILNIATPSDSFESKDFSLIPFYDVNASAGHGALVDTEAIKTQLAFRKDWLATEGLQVGSLCAITARGESMEPTVPDGSLLLLDSSQREINGDHIYIIRKDTHLYAKRLQLLYSGECLIISDNSAYHTETILSENIKTLDIVGRVVWIGHRI